MLFIFVFFPFLYLLEFLEDFRYFSDHLRSRILSSFHSIFDSFLQVFHPAFQLFGRVAERYGCGENENEDYDTDPPNRLSSQQNHLHSL